MLVKDVMQTAVLTAPPDLPLPKVLRLLQGRGFRHVPVVDGNTLVGIISDRDVKQAMASAAASAEGRERDQLLDRLTAGQIMTRSVRTIGPAFAIEDAVKLMVSERISAVPVTEGGRLQGIVTETDVLNLFARATGVLEPSSRVDVLIPDGSGEELGGVVRAVEATGARISSIITFGGAAARGGDAVTGREVVLRLATIDPGPAVKALTAAGYRVRNGARPRRA
jgi:acetoin utilization protein AcuB